MVRCGSLASSLLCCSTSQHVSIDCEIALIINSLQCAVYLIVQASDVPHSIRKVIEELRSRAFRLEIEGGDGLELLPDDRKEADKNKPRLTSLHFEVS